MRPDESDEHTPLRETDYHNEAIVVAFDIEHISVVSHIVHIVEHRPDVRKVSPFGSPGGFVPILKRLFRLWMGCIVFNQCTFRYYVHDNPSWFYNAKIQTFLQIAKYFYDFCVLCKPKGKKKAPTRRLKNLFSRERGVSRAWNTSSSGAESYRICVRLQFLLRIEESRMEALLLAGLGEAVREVHAEEPGTGDRKVFLGTANRQRG